MASYVDPGLYANKEDMHQRICTSCGAIVHTMSTHVHDLFHERNDINDPDLNLWRVTNTARETIDDFSSAIVCCLGPGEATEIVRNHYRSQSKFYSEGLNLKAEAVNLEAGQIVMLHEV